MYSDLLQSTLNITKLQSVIEKLENQLRQEKVKNKTNLVQIKKLQTYPIVSGTEPNNILVVEVNLPDSEMLFQPCLDTGT